MKYPVRITRAANGIRAQDLRALNRGSWWARRWLNVLEDMHLGARLGRARQYATNGQITRLAIHANRVTAECMGSRPIPYQMSLEFLPLTPAAHRAITKQLRAEPMLLARLLNGDLPTDVEEIFRAQGAPLFPNTPNITLPPARKYDIAMHCSCPDWARPCKHLIAVMLLLGEDLAERPARLLSLRGLDLATLIPPATSSHSSSSLIPHPSSLTNLQPLTSLGTIPFWRGHEKFADALARIHKRVQPVAHAAASAQSIDLRNKK